MTDVLAGNLWNANLLSIVLILLTHFSSFVINEQHMDNVTSDLLDTCLIRQTELIRRFVEDLFFRQELLSTEEPTSAHDPYREIVVGMKRYEKASSEIRNLWGRYLACKNRLLVMLVLSLGCWLVGFALRDYRLIVGILTLILFVAVVTGVCQLRKIGNRVYGYRTEEDFRRKEKA